MSIVDRIEYLGKSVDTGRITRDSAVQDLLECSDGGYTRRGAEDLINRHSEVRAQYVQEFSRAREGLRSLES